MELPDFAVPLNEDFLRAAADPFDGLEENRRDPRLEPRTSRLYKGWRACIHKLLCKKNRVAIKYFNQKAFLKNLNFKIDLFRTGCVTKTSLLVLLVAPKCSL